MPCIRRKTTLSMSTFRHTVARAAACLVVCLAGSSSLGATLERGQIRLQYSQGQEAVALETMGVLHTGLATYAQRLPAGEEPIRVHICQTIAEFEGLSGGLPAKRVQGFARSREGLIVLKAPVLLGPGSDYAGIVRHELLHVLLARNTDLDHLPRWLNEGVAMILSRENRWSTMFSMARLYTGGRVIAYENLEQVFNAPGNEMVFGDAYVQSLSMTRYLQSQMGEETFWAMIYGLQDGPFDEALRSQTELTAEEFYDTWRGSLWRTALVFSIVTGMSLFQIAAILLVVAYLRKRMRNRRTLQKWAEEEEDAF